MIQVLRNRAFRHIWLGSHISTMGSQVSRIGLILYVFNTSDSVLNLALLVALEMLPGAVVSPLAGVVIDGCSKRRVMILSDLVRMVLMAVILFRPTLSVIYLMAALHSIATVFYQPAKTAFIPSIVKRQDLPEANGLDQSASSLILIAGPIIGAELLIHFGLAATLIVDSLSFLISASLLSGVQTNVVEHGTRRRSAVIAEIREGWSYLIQHRLTLHLNGLLFVALVCTGTWVPLAPFFIRERLGGSEQVLGWQLSIFGMGAVLGGILAPRLMDRFGAGVFLIVGFLAEGICQSLYALVSHMGASMVMILLWGVAVSLAVVPFYSILQMVVDKRFLGRVFSVIKQSENIALVLAVLAAVGLKSFLGSHVIFLIAGLSYFGFAAAFSLSKGGKTLLATR